MKVQVYKNLHNGKWSIKSNGLVIGHADKVIISDVTGKISEAGRQRVLRGKSKNVHAFLEGTLEFTKGFTSYKGRDIPITYKIGYPKTDSYLDLVVYNPYRYDSFMKISKSNYRLDKFNGCEWLELSKTANILGY